VTDITFDLVGCARCHGDGHPGLTFAKLRYPVESSDPPLTHWALCPANGEPILLAFVVRDSVLTDREPA
jgi:hypothetical protein